MKVIRIELKVGEADAFALGEITDAKGHPLELADGLKGERTGSIVIEREISDGQFSRLFKAAARA